MSADYNSIPLGGTGADGYGYGANGIPQGWLGALLGGDPTSPISNLITIGGAGGGTGAGVTGTPISAPITKPRTAGVANTNLSSIKPMLSQLLGISTPGMQPRARPRMAGGAPSTGPTRPISPPIVRRPIAGGPRPIPRPVAAGGAMRGGMGAPVSRPMPRVRQQSGGPG